MGQEACCMKRERCDDDDHLVTFKPESLNIPLTDSGYNRVLSSGDRLQMRIFLRRILEESGGCVRNQYQLANFVDQECEGQEDQTLVQLLQHLETEPWVQGFHLPSYIKLDGLSEHVK
eukprot:gb/GFBE01024043.1/.p1 GENE.gb/GFBE01024043.1/~~gb/GFBE01024043.1/.p1  ORF type:complete len:118 (+),score=22.17 gb/GFBE01024043.1/:1-354(+)